MTDRSWKKKLSWGLALAGLVLLGAWGMGARTGLLRAPETPNPCAARTINPCAAKTLNPCMAKTLNPCAAKTLNPCLAKAGNPCAMKGQSMVSASPRNACNPCAMKAANPCNPCGGAMVDAARFKQPDGMTLARGSKAHLVARGEELWNDRTLGKSGLACANCHVNNYLQMQSSFAEPYPHYVAMAAQQGGVDEVSAAEMVQFCMLVPMATDPLPWNSEELASLAAWVENIQPGYVPLAETMTNPCNPCGAGKNPCSPRSNPCSR